MVVVKATSLLRRASAAMYDGGVDVRELFTGMLGVAVSIKSSQCATCFSAANYTTGSILRITFAWTATLSRLCHFLS